jgi:hypothetical protein|tara:strand:- start:42 stop:848 length:807 start_codon:yes stop_codon:yes gene_type:complete
MPPMSAAATMAIPQVGPDGVRQTINAYITPAQATWNVRSALNVAALNCMSPAHAGILENYKVFLTNFDKPLDRANDKVEAEFREKFGDRRTGRAELDSYMTKVYNYFTMPPAKSAFCDAALELSNESVLVAPADLDSFSARALARFEGVFEDFFRSFERYQTNLATWDRLYGTPAGLYPSYGPTTQVADNEAAPGTETRVLLNAPIDNPGAQSVTIPQATQSVDVTPSTAATEGDQQQPVTGGIVLPETATASTAGDLQGPPAPDPSR